jgi:glyceraldehyde 3-phosphate dehydrogenase
MKIKVAINGFGRIGRQFFAIAKNYPTLDIVAINDLTDAKTLAYLYKYDSIYGIHPEKIKAGDNILEINNKKIKTFAENDPLALPWKKLGIDLVIESTGVLKDYKSVAKHLTAGAKKVIITAPVKEKNIPTYIIGCNEKKYNSKTERVISMASCTTNALAPIAKVLNENFGIIKGEMTTIHSYTNDQKLLDLPHKDLRRAKAAGLSMIPTTTGATIAVEKVVPELKGKMSGLSIRVPTPIVSLVDFSFLAKKNTTREKVNEVLRQAAKKELKNIIDVTDEPLVSIDFKQSPLSGIVDSLLTEVVDKNLIKVLVWYDNEWGYSTRLVELAKMTE